MGKPADDCAAREYFGTGRQDDVRHRASGRQSDNEGPAVIYPVRLDEADHFTD